MKLSKATYGVIAVVVLAFVGAMLFFRYNIPGEEKLLAAIKQAEQQYGVDNPKMVTILSLAVAKYQLAGHPDKAVDVSRRIVAIDIKHTGAVSSATVSSKHQLAMLMDEVDEVEQADALYVEINRAEQQLVKKEGKAKDIKNNKLYKPIVRLWLTNRINGLKALQEPEAQDTDMLQRYQRRLKMLAAPGDARLIN